MNAAQLINEAAAAGLRLELTEDGRIVVKPSARATPEIIQRLRPFKPQLIEHLRRRAELSARAVAALNEQPGRLRSAVMEPMSADTYMAAVAIRMEGGDVAVALLTNIRGNWHELLLAFDRSCTLPTQ